MCFDSDLVEQTIVVAPHTFYATSTGELKDAFVVSDGDVYHPPLMTMSSSSLCNLIVGKLTKISIGRMLLPA